jgi:ketosteroid isomerase-like protein
VTFPREEIEATVERYVDVRNRIDAGELGWDALVQFFTDDAVFIDPAWGRVEGIDGLAHFFVESMAGLDDWTFPIEFTAISGDNVVIKWSELFPRADGGTAAQSGWSRLIYAGDGKFRYEEDILNMTHVLEDISSSGWQPTGPMNLPPKHPNRDWSIPPG